jgi:hypothetical protein
VNEKDAKEWKPDNKAESDLMERADQAYELFIQSLTAEFRKILLTEE